MIRIRASALSDLFDCPARFEAKELRHLHLPPSGAAQLGTAIHASTGAFDASSLKGKSLSIEDCAGVLIDVIHKPDEDVAWDDEMGPRDAEDIGLALHRKYCRDVAPTQRYAAVEVTCERLEITDLDLVLTGTTDRIRRVNDGHGIADLKTGKTAVGADGSVRLAGHAAQLGVYELLAQEASGIAIREPAQIIGLQTGKTAKAQRIGTAEVGQTRELLVGTPDEPGLLQLAADIVHSGRFYGNPRSMLCSQKYCPAFPTCRFRR